MYAQYQKCAFVVAGIQLAPYVGLARFPAPTTGSLIIVNIGVMAGGTINALGDSIFDVKVNGVTIFASDAVRPKILSGASSGGVGIGRGQVIVHEIVDEITVDLKSVPAGGIGGPMWIIVTIDNSVTSNRWVTDLYNGALARNPTSGELSAGVDTLEDAMIVNTPKAVRDAANTLAGNIFAGAEYIARGRSNAQFVDDLYHAVLGRPPESSDVVDIYVALLVGGMTRAAMVSAFALSTESANNRLNEVYPGALPYGDAQYLLGIPVTSVGLANDTALKYDSANGRFIFGAAGGSSPSRGDVGYTTASLANNADEVGTIALGKSGVRFKIVADRACRVRIYGTAAKRDADRARAAGAARTAQDYMWGEYNLPASALTYVEQDPAGTWYYNLDSPIVGTNIYITIQNLSGSTSTVTVTFTRLALEA